MIDQEEAKRIAASLSKELHLGASKASQQSGATQEAARGNAAGTSPGGFSGFLQERDRAMADSIGTFTREFLQGTARSLVGFGRDLTGQGEKPLGPEAGDLQRGFTNVVFGREGYPSARGEGRELFEAFGADEQLARNLGEPTGLALGLLEFTPLDEALGGAKALFRGTKTVSKVAAGSQDVREIYRALDSAVQRLPQSKRIEAASALVDINDAKQAEEYLNAFLKENNASAYDFAPKEVFTKLDRLQTEAARIAAKADPEIAAEAAAAYRQISAIRKIADEAGTGKGALNDMLAGAEDAYRSLSNTIKATSRGGDDAVKAAVRASKLAPEKNPAAVKAGFDVLEDGRVAPKLDEVVRDEAVVAAKTRAIEDAPTLAKLSDISNGRFPRPVEGDTLIAELGEAGAELTEALAKYPGGTAVRGIYATSPKEAAEKWLANVTRGTNPEFGNMDAVAVRTADGEVVADAGQGGKFFSEQEIQDAILEGKKERGFATSIKESQYTSPELAQQVESLYDPISNKQTLAEATEILAKGDDEALSFVTNAKQPTATSNAVAQLLIEKFQTEGKLAQAVDLVELIAERVTSPAQAIQILSLWNRMTPAGILRYADKTLKNVGKKLSPDLSKKLVDMAIIIKKMDAGWEKSFETQKMMKLISDEIPVTRLKKIATLQSIMLLVNPKTWIRNLVGNTGFAALEQVSDVAAAGLDSAVSLLTGVRTKVPPDVLVQARGALKGAERGWKEAMAGVNTLQTGTQFDIPQTAVFKNKGLERVPAALEKLLNIELRVPDRMFYQAAYDGSIYNQLKAYNLTQKKRGMDTLLDPTPEMIETATHEALYRTFQDDSAIASALVGLKRVLNGGKDFGLGDVLIKFPKTPGNLLARGIDYSPVGFVNTVYQAARPLIGKPFNQRKFVESFGRALTGSGSLVGTGLILSQLGILSGGNSDKPVDVKGAERAIGLGDYKINVDALKRFVLSGMDAEATKPQKGDTLVTYDWFQPAALPMAVGANIGENKGVVGGTFLGDVFDAVLKGADALVEQPVLSNLNKFADDTSYYGVFGALGRQLANVPASFVPTLFNQVRQLIDNDSRNTYSPDAFQYAMNQAAGRVPGLSETLPRRYNTFGDKQEVYQEGSNNFMNVFFNPLFVSKYKDDPAIKMVLDVYEDTGDTGAVPDAKRYKQTINGESTQIGPKTYEKFSRFVGRETRKQMYGLSQDPRFAELEPEEKSKYIANVLRDIHAFSKIVVLGDRPKSPDKRVRVMLDQYAATQQQP